MQNHFENIIKRQKNLYNIQNQQNSFERINDLLNDKIKKYSEIVNEQLNNILQTSRKQLQENYQIVEERLKMSIEEIKKHVTEYIESSRNKNNSYWLKIKDALGKINLKIIKVE